VITLTTPYQIVYRALIADTQGYARAARKYILALDQLGVDVKIEPVDVGSPDAKLDDKVRKRLNQLINKPYATNKPKVLLYHMQPSGVDPIHERTRGYDKVVIKTVFETTKVPANWFPNVNQADAVFCPSQQNVQAFKDSGITPPIYLAPHGADTDAFNPRNKKFPLDTKGKFTFLSVFQWQHRKSPDLLLRAYWEEFSERDNVALVLKTYWGNSGLKSDQRAVLNQIMQYKQNLGHKNTAPIYFSPSLFSDDDLKGLYTLSDCFVLPSRGEGVGLPYIEALSSGIPCIAPNWGGQIDFLNEGNSFLFDYDLVPTDYNNGYHVAPNFSQVFTSDMQWSEPKLSDLRKKMRYAYNHQDEVKEKGKQGRKDMKKMSWEIGAKVIKQAVEDLLK
jgi:glycosyltransferase involved in cell wall biosynthesis